MKERWKPIPGFNAYEASTHGRIRSVDRMVYDKGFGGLRRCRGTVLKPTTNKNGYAYVELTVESKGITCTVHRLVALAWLPNPANLPEVDHVHGNKPNNAIDNLEWVSTLENRRRAWALGLYKKPKGEQMPTARLTEADVIEMRRLYDSCQIQNQSELSRKFNVTSATAHNVVTRKSWRHI